MKIAVISDTHGVLKDSLLLQLQDCDYILHAGDIGTQECYLRLRELKIPLYIIRGNCDRGEWCRNLPETLAAPIGGRIFYLIHKKSQLPYPLPEADFIISGHTHAYSVSCRGSVTYLNPGSAGRSRSGAPLSMAVVTLDEDSRQECPPGILAWHDASPRQTRGSISIEQICLT